MCKKFLLLSIFSLIIITIFVIYSKEYNSIPKNNISDRGKDFTTRSGVDSRVADLIADINKKNELIKDFFSNKTEVRVWESIHKFKLHGNINYQKPSNFRLELYSVFGKELDLGSNDEIFWYWSKRDRRPGVYWAKYEDFYKTRLKNPFNPMFMRATLGFEIIDLKDVIISQNNVDIMLTYKRKNSMDQTIFFSIIANKFRKQIDGFIISDSQNNTLATCEIQERNGEAPSKILYSWNEEKRTMLIDLNNCFTNKNLNQSTFDIPDLAPKINMANE